VLFPVLSSSPTVHVAALSAVPNLLARKDIQTVKHTDVTRSAMKLNGIASLLTMFLLGGAVSAQNISGTILIKKRLTRRSVTAPVSVYQRGTTVGLARNVEEDPIAYEHSRVVVYLEGTIPAGAAPTAAADGIEIRQIDRHFSPDLVAVPAGATVSFPNMDPIFHNIYSLSRAKSFDLGAYEKGETRRVSFLKPGIVEIYCHLHPNMEATVVVTPNRYYARPDRSGHYQIRNVPPGHYTLIAWHKKAGFFRKSVDVGTGHPVTADFFIPVEADSSQETEADRESEYGTGLR
jgi:plastocyanin